MGHATTRDYRGNSLKRNELYRDVGRVHLFHEFFLFLFPPPPPPSSFFSLLLRYGYVRIG